MIKESHIDDDSSIWTKQVSLLYTFLDATDNLVAVFDAKSGVGATTVAACLSGVLTNHNSLYLEIAPSSSGYVYYGDSLSAYFVSARFDPYSGL